MGRRIFFSFNGSRVNRTIHQKKDHFMIWDWEFVIESIKNKVGSSHNVIIWNRLIFFTVFSQQACWSGKFQFWKLPSRKLIENISSQSRSSLFNRYIRIKSGALSVIVFLLCILLCPVQCTLSLWFLWHCLPLQVSSGSNFQFSLRQTKNSICFHLFQIHYKTMSGFWWCWLIIMKF